MLVYFTNHRGTRAHLGLSSIINQYQAHNKRLIDMAAGWSLSRTLNWTDVLLLRWAGLTACLMLLGSKSTLGEVTQNSSWAQHRLYAEGTPHTKTTVGQRPVNTHKCCLSSCVASATCVCEDVWVWAQKLFLERAQACHSTRHETNQNIRAWSASINLVFFFLHGGVDSRQTG